MRQCDLDGCCATMRKKLNAPNQQGSIPMQRVDAEQNEIALQHAIN